MPYGEILMELSNKEYNNPYKYNGKEFDEATGYYYYGARYYDPKRSFWLSVDPLAEITQSPYTYVWNDPVNFADPSGMMGERVGGEGPGDPKKRSFTRRAIDWIVGLFGRGVDKGYKSNVRLKANNTIQVGLPTKMSEQEYQTTCWDEGDTHYQQVTSNTLITRKIGANNESPQYRFILPQNFGGWSQDNTGSDGLIWKGCLSCHADNGAFSYATHNSQEANAGKMLSSILQTAVGGNFGKGNTIEGDILREANTILKKEKILNEIFNEGVGKEIKIGNRTMVIEPEAPFSGFTLFEENAFVIGKEAFSSRVELRKTLLQELYRLNSRALKGKNVTQEAVSQ